MLTPYFGILAKNPTLSKAAKAALHLAADCHYLIGTPLVRYNQAMGQILSENSTAIALVQKRGKKGARPGGVSLNPEQRSDSTGSAVQDPWTKTKPAAQLTSAPSKPRTSLNSKKALHLCLKRIKAATDETELRRLTEELQRILFHRQYQNAEN